MTATAMSDSVLAASTDTPKSAPTREPVRRPRSWLAQFLLTPFEDRDERVRVRR
ncbi:MAG: hypothetical protein JO038_06775 [Alphaproteobacteria bacterium]|nr:hypothetical protein [Alphaproteobacteria bacterium]